MLTQDAALFLRERAARRRQPYRNNQECET